MLILTTAPVTARDVHALGRCFATLVQHVVDGAIRDVHVIAQNPPPEFVALADDAGATVHAEASAAIAAAKSERILILEAGMLVSSGIIEELWQRALSAREAPAALITIASQGWSLRALWYALYPRIGGLVVSRHHITGTAAFTIDSLRRRLKAPLRLKATLTSAL